MGKPHSLRPLSNSSPTSLLPLTGRAPPLPPRSRRFRQFAALFTFLLFTITLSIIQILNISPYDWSRFLEAAVPCRVHLQAKCFTHPRDWKVQLESQLDSEKEQNFLEGEESIRFRDQCGDWRAWTRDFEERQRSVMAGDSSVPVLLWYCDSFSSCHGLGDRFRGIQTTFLLALLSERAFVIKSDRPSPLSFALRPASNNLTFDFEDVRGVLPGRIESKIKNDNMLWETLDEYQHVNWTTRLTDVTWVHSNVPALSALLLNPSFADSPLLPLLAAIEPASLPGCLTHYLFRPTRRLQASIDNLLPPSTSPATTTVGIQIRLGDAVMSGEQISDEAAQWKWHEEKLDELIQQHPRQKFRFFVASDSTRAREHFVIRLSRHGAVFAGESTPTHVNEISTGPLQLAGFYAYEDGARFARLALENTLVEWYALQKSDVIISSRSNFAETAALAAFLTSTSANVLPSKNATARFGRPVLLKHQSQAPSLRGVQVEGLSSVARKMGGSGIEGWWYWCLEQGNGGVKGRLPRAEMVAVKEEWCRKWMG